MVGSWEIFTENVDIEDLPENIDRLNGGDESSTATATAISTAGEADVESDYEEPTNTNKRKRRSGAQATATEHITPTSSVYPSLASFGMPKWTKLRGKNKRFDFKLTPEVEPLDDSQKELVEKLENLSSIKLFELFFDSETYNMIIDQTNLYAQQNNSNFRLNLESLKRFIGILLLSGYHTLPATSDYWSTSPSLGVPLVQQSMSRNNFTQIKRHIHFNDNNNLNKEDKMAKVIYLLSSHIL